MYIISVDLRGSKSFGEDGCVVFIEDNYNRTAVYDKKRDAIACAERHPLCKNNPYKIVKFDFNDLELIPFRS